tara:strand:- start:83 stop:517 length:435 start_codon:yes stop_codon:yes gene_type:complete
MKASELSPGSQSTPAEASKERSYLDQSGWITIGIDAWSIVISHINMGSKQRPIFIRMILDAHEEIIAKRLIYGNELDQWMIAHMMTTRGFAETILNEPNQRIALDLATMVHAKLSEMLAAKNYDERILIDRKWRLEKGYIGNIK